MAEDVLISAGVQLLFPVIVWLYGVVLDCEYWRAQRLPTTGLV